MELSYREVLQPRLLVLSAALLFSTGGAAIKSTGLSPWQVAGFRAGVAAVAILLAVPAARRVNDGRILLAGAGYAVMGISFVVANKLTTAANAIFLQDTAPVYVMLLFSPLLLREPVHRGDWLFLLAMAAGVAMFFAGDPVASRTAPDPVRGNLVALVSAVSWAGSVSALRWMHKSGIAGDPGMATVVAGNALAFLATLPLSIQGPAPSTGDAVAILYLGLIQVALGYVLLTRGIRNVSAVQASLLMMSEPAFSPLWAYLLHGEVPNAWAMAGGAVILAATAGRVFARSHN